MSHLVEVDQNGKIGDTQGPTVLAFSNGTNFAILIPANVKREYLHELRRRGKSGPTLYLEFFALSLYLLLRNHIHDLEQITIDIEYPGHDATIKENLLALLLRRGFSINAHRIRFDQIHQGKKHPGAHDRVYYTWRGTVAPDKVIRLGELLAEAK